MVIAGQPGDRFDVAEPEEHDRYRDRGERLQFRFGAQQRQPEHQGGQRRHRDAEHDTASVLPSARLPVTPVTPVTPRSR